MDQYTHAWIACKAVERLSSDRLDPGERQTAARLVELFDQHKDGVIQGAWYPDSVYKDNATSHIMKHTPTALDGTYRETGRVPLPANSLLQQLPRPRDIDPNLFYFDTNNNLPERCEALAHAVIDNLKIQYCEDKGSPVSPTGNHIALLLFALSHYIADAHMPLHCDARSHDARGFKVHSAVEDYWGSEVKKYYAVDESRGRFYYDPYGAVMHAPSTDFDGSILDRVEKELAARAFTITYGDAGNVLDYMFAVTHCSYLAAWAWLPEGYTIDRKTLEVSSAPLTFADMSVAVLADAVDAVARVWYRVIRRYLEWEKE